MFTDYLQPVSKELQDFSKSCNSFCLGSSLKFEPEVLLDSSESESQLKIALIGVQETRSKNTDELEDLDFDLIRRSFYALKIGDWNLPIYDFGDLVSAVDKTTTGEIFTKILAELVKNNYLVMIIGASPSMAYFQYRAYDKLIKNLNYFSVDEQLRFGNELLNPNDENYLTKIISSEPLNLLDFTNLGYQRYFVGQEELDLIDQLNFEAIRLGDLTSDIREFEPYVREANAGVINLSSIEANSFLSTKDITPNGFNSREICSLAKYIGSSNVLSSIYISNYSEEYKKVDHLLVSQILWYIIDGRNHRAEIKKIDDTQYFEKFFVPSDIQEFIFYHNIFTNQWWLEINESEIIKVIPCSSSDYERAIMGEIPNRWWKYFKKFY